MFRFKQFNIDDSSSAMKIGTDGVLLGAWAFSNYSPRHIIDAGTGSGLIALMLAQRFPEARITAIEIESDAAEQARRNIAASPWHDRITVEHTDFLHFTTVESVDAIVSNPPFFDEPILSPDTKRATARHETSMTIEKLIDHAASLLKPGGRLAFIAPSHRESQLTFHAAKSHLDVELTTSVRPTDCQPPFRVMLQARKGLSDIFNSDEIAIRSNGRYTTAYRKLTENFYLPQTFK